MRSLNSMRSSRVSESDLAITGTTLTTSESFFNTTMSMGLRLIMISLFNQMTESYLRVTRWLDKEETTVYSSILDVSLSLGGKFFPEVG